MPKYKWHIGEPPPFIDAHSKNKHSIYEGYLRRYIEKLTQNPKHPSFKLAIVDGFCGGGVYQDQNNKKHLGSPFIVFSAVDEALTRAREKRKNPINAQLRYYFVDKDKSSVDYLKQAHKEHEINKNSNYPVIYMDGRFADVCQRIIDDIKCYAPRKQRALLLLDQYGWTHVPLNIISQIISQLSDAEIVLTFTPDEILDYTSENTMRNMITSFKRIGFDMKPKEIMEIMRSENHPYKWMPRMIAQELLADEIKKKIQTTYFTRYYIKSANTHRSLMLVHLSRHPAAHNEMMEEHWTNSNINLNHQGYAGVSPLSPLVLGYNLDREENLFRGEDFFQREKIVVNAMMKQIPGILHAHQMGLSFGLLVDQLRNIAPITEKIMKKVIDELLQHKEINVINHKNGKERYRCGSGLHMDDQIKLARQKNLF